LSKKPHVTLECGSGSSTLMLARCAQKIGTGHVYSLEHNATYANKTRQELAAQGLENWATVIDAPLVDYSSLPGHYWYSLDNLQLEDGCAELLVIDGPPYETCRLARYPSIPLLRRYLSINASIVLDDAYRDDEKEILRQWKTILPNVEMIDAACEKGCVVIH